MSDADSYSESDSRLPRSTYFHQARTRLRPYSSWRRNETCCSGSFLGMKQGVPADVIRVPNGPAESKSMRTGVGGGPSWLRSESPSSS